MSHDDFEEPDFAEDNFEEDHNPAENDVFEESEDDDKASNTGKKEKSKPDLKKYALPAILLVVIGGLVLEGGKIKNMIMGSSANTPITSSHPAVHSMNTLPKVSPNPVLPATKPELNQPALNQPSLNHNVDLPDANSPPQIPSVSKTPVLNAPPVLNTPAIGETPDIPNKPLGIISPTIDNKEKAIQNTSSSNFTDVLSVLHDNGQKIADSTKEITSSVQDSATNINSHIDTRTQEIENKLDALAQKTNAFSDKLDNLSKGAISLPNTGKEKTSSEAPGTSLGHHKVKPVVRKKKIIKKVERPKVEQPNGTLTDYHLLGVSKKTVLLQGPNGKYIKVNMGEAPSGSAGETIGTVEGVVNEGGNNWYLRTSKGKITE